MSIRRLTYLLRKRFSNFVDDLSEFFLSVLSLPWRFFLFITRGLGKLFTNIPYPFSRVELGSTMGKRQVTGLLPVIGYTIFIASLGDFIYPLFPLRLQNPTWELQTLGTLLEQTWGFLVGLALIFSRYLIDNQSDVRRIDILGLRFIRWIVLLIGIIFLLSNPLVVFNTMRLYTTINQQVQQRDAATLDQVRQAENQLSQISDSTRLIGIAQSVGLNPKTLENSSGDQIKTAVKQRLNAIKTNNQTEIQSARKEQLQGLFKSSARTLLYSLIVSFTFIFVSFKLGRFNREF
ncbi:MAG: HpsJ family protein [Cylindrospermopsis raciborskii 1523720]|uniref:HpsJ-like protein, cyanoexosortase A-associated n=1 Tax=Cylindrospermopsis raciborskii TaxID=77022 RepID=UPI002B4A3FD5|nr:HpsJ family protein [Cylindrospermopsis raciborskii]MEB3146520.1 HpsJ family protein [Cylindrospermopsis raciborskii]